MFSWNIRVPLTKSDFYERDKLLNDILKSQRGGSICEEYPLVLGQDSFQFSYCMFRLDDLDKPCEMIAHLNYFPREIIDASGKILGSIAMIANVSTNEKYRGKGVMSEFIRIMQKRARLEGQKGILLWSDQDLFYQNRGFNKVGHEYHFLISRQALYDKLSKQKDFRTQIYEKIEMQETRLISWSQEDLSKLIKARYPVSCTLSRSLDEYRKLMKIPNTYIAYPKGDLGRGFAIMNRGSDMLGAVHEWGASDSSVLESLLLRLMFEREMEEILLLAPFGLDHDLINRMSQIGSLDKNSLGYFWDTHGDQSPKIFDVTSGFFVWGMDSI